MFNNKFFSYYYILLHDKDILEIKFKPCLNIRTTVDTITMGLKYGRIEFRIIFQQKIKKNDLWPLDLNL